MKNIIFIIFFILIGPIANAQKSQSIAYIDMEYILENVSEYLEAQNTLNEKVEIWRKKLDKQARYIEVLKTDLANEKAILTEDLIIERENEISLKQEELRRLESLYFGPNGDMFNLRKELVKPIQDQIYNAIQDIAAKKRYDFVFDKSTEPIMLYSNKKYDISELILATINKDRKREEIKDLKAQPKQVEFSEKEKELIAEKEKEAEIRQEQKKAAKEAMLDKRARALELRAEKRRILREKQQALRKQKEEARNTKKDTIINN
jgi:Skp family chaperone for outer membrane proteins